MERQRRSRIRGRLGEFTLPPIIDGPVIGTDSPIGRIRPVMGAEEIIHLRLEVELEVEQGAHERRPRRRRLVAVAPFSRYRDAVPGPDALPAPTVFAVVEEDGRFLGLVEAAQAALFPGPLFAELMARERTLRREREELGKQLESELESRRIAAGPVNMAHTLGLNVVAQG